MSDIDPEQAHGLPQDGSVQQSAVAQRLVRHFADAASSVLSQIAGGTLEAEAAPLESAVEAATVLRVEIGGALEGVCELELSAPMTAQFAALLMGGPAVTEITDELREAAAELIQQICGNAADRLRAEFGPLELKPGLLDPGLLKSGLAREPESAAGLRQRLRIRRSDGAQDAALLEIELHMLRLAATAQSPATMAPTEAAAPSASHSSDHAAASPADETGRAGTAASAMASPAASPVTQSGNRNLDLLLDFELGVTLRFGSRQMPLRDILELSSGSVVELDRRVEEPVDLLIDGRVIAQGEVVIIEGNYGLRILQVATQGEKLACLQ